MRRRERERGGPRWVSGAPLAAPVAALAAVVAAATLAGCSADAGGAARGGLEPASVHEVADDGAARRQPTTGSDPTTTSPATASTAPPTEPAADGSASDDEWRELADSVLLRYAVALTELAVDPVARTAAGTPQRRAWDSTVLEGSWLSASVPAELVRRHREDGVVVLPPSTGLSYRHRALRVERPSLGTLSFTWCGWSPGIGIDVATGEVVDDVVAHAHGTGQLREIGSTWMLEALDEVELAELPPGSPDPCPPEVAAVADEEGGR